jgi:transposase InsO family protein
MKNVEDQWKQEKRKMDRKGMYVNAWIDRVHEIQAFVDSGCLCFATVSDRFAQKAKLQRIAIKRRPLHQVVDEQEPIYIDTVVHFKLDIDGHEEFMFAYEIPGQEDDVMLGKGWMERHDVMIEPKWNKLTVRAWNAEVHCKKIVMNPNIKRISAAALTAHVQRSRRERKPLQIFSVSIRDIQKALQQKVHSDPKQKLPDWMQDLADAFDRKEANRLPPHRPGIDHSIELEKDQNGKEKELPWSPLYGMSKDELLVLRKTISDLTDKGFIRASSSSAAAPAIFVKKPGGGLRFVVDYRKLNEITKKDRYPLPLIQETLRTIAKAKWISKVDVIQAFHRIRIKEGDEHKTAFRTRYGSYEWLVTPFGLTGAPATFQRYINWTLRDLLDICCSAYVDDVLIYTSGSRKEHRLKVKEVVARLNAAGLQLDVDKSAFEVKSVKYLGYIVEAGKGVRVDPEKIKAIVEWEQPTTVKGVRGFLGFANYYREFVKNYSEIARPLTALTKKGQEFRWTEECSQAFEELKNALINSPIRAQFDPDRETFIECDSSGYVVGGELSQKGDDELIHPVAYFSKKLAPMEANYPIHDKEMLAIILCLRHWRAELLSVEKFTVYSDHKNLKHFLQKQRLSERQARWYLELSEFNFEIVHRAGKAQIVSDALSRRDQDLPKDWNDDRLAERDRQILRTNKQGNIQIKTDMDNQTIVTVSRIWTSGADQDPDDEPELTEAEKAAPPTNPFEDEKLQELWEQGLEKNKRYWKIRHKVRSGERKLPTSWGLAISISECHVDEGNRLRWRDRIWIPNYEPLRTAIIQKIHDHMLGGHGGRESTRDLVARRFNWPGMAQDIRRFVRNCDHCGASKPWREQKKGLLKPLPIPERVWQELSMDFVTELPPSDGYSNLLVIRDRLSKSVVLEPMKSITAESTATALLNNVFKHHGLPRSIVSDRGPQFVSLTWKRICELLKIQRKLSTAYHPQTDGSTERANQEIEGYLRVFATYTQDNWARLLPSAMIAINNRTSASTGFSPFFLTHGYHLDLVEISAEADEQRSEKSPVAKGTAFVEKLARGTELAQAAIAAAQEIQEKNSNRRRQASEAFKVGDRVWLKLKNIKTDRPSKKLDWLASKYTVLELVGSHNCRLDVPPGIHDVFHVDLLKRAQEDPLPSQQRVYMEPPAILNDKGEEEYEIEEIVKHRKRGQGWQVKVQWKGYQQPTWEPLKDLYDTAALERYEHKLGDGIPWPREGGG